MPRFVIYKATEVHSPSYLEPLPNIKKNTKSCNSMFEFRSYQSLSKTQHCLSQDISNKILLCYH